MVLPLFGQNTSANIEVTGTVVDAANVPVPGVNVVEKGTSNGVVTDFDGEYRITVKSGSTLLFTYLGMEAISVPVNGNNVLNVTMREDAESLDEVVIVGYGSQKREAVTGAIETIDGNEIEYLPVGNLASALVGRVLGVGVSGGESRPGQPAQITIRAPVSGNNIRAKDRFSQEPLYVIDGVQQIDAGTGLSDATYFNTLDASQVESITFLKDASAAIYGARSSQGVVLVTTKRGKKGPAKFTYTGNFSVADETFRHDMLNAYQYANVFNIINGPNGAGRTYDPTDPAPDNRYFFSPTELEFFKNNTHDALDEYWKPAGTQRHNLNISGGSEDATYFGGISYFTQDGNLGTLNYDRWSFRVGTNLNLGKGFKANMQVSGFFTEQARTTSKIGSENNENDFTQLQNRAPYLPLYINGLPTIQIGSSGTDALAGFHYGEIERLQNLAESNDSNVTVNLGVEYELPFLKGFVLNANYSRQEGGGRGSQIGSKFNLYEFFGADSDLTDNQRTPGQTYILYESGSGPLGTNLVREEIGIVNADRLLIDNTRLGNEQIRFQASFERDFGLHNISSLFALERAERYQRQERIIKFGVPDWSNGMLWQTTGDFDERNTYNWRRVSADLGYIGRLNYNYDSKYFAEVLFRTDASAKFAPENYWGKFYSLSGGWIISKEDFFKSNTIDFLKIRASVGMTGKDDTRAWQWRQNFQTSIGGGVVFGGNGGVGDAFTPNVIANRDVRWGKELKTNVGVDARFLNNRLSVTFETFYNIGTEALINLTQGVPFTVGGTISASNNGRYNTWGKEISLSWNDYIGKDFTYNVTINTGWYRSDIIEGDFQDPMNWYPWQDNRPGNPDIGTWGWDNLGMFRSQEDIDTYLAESGVTQIFNKTAEELRPGMLYYRDVRGAWDPETRTFAEKDGIINEWDQIQLEKPAKGPQGFSSAIRAGYKGFNLNAVLTVNWGAYRDIGQANNSLSSNNITGNYQNRPAFWSNMYDPILNPTGKIPNLAVNNGQINTVRSQFWEVSGFSMAMRNISLSYSIPNTLAEKLGLRSFRLDLVGVNPFILYNPYKDYGLSPYNGYNNYPVLRTYSLGVNVGF